MFSFLKRILIGKPLRTEQLKDEKLPIWKALPILSSDALSSLSYGTQELLHVFVPLGLIVSFYSLPITLAIIGLLFLLIMSYRQIVYQYPGGGGAYVVSSENMGFASGLVAGSALLIDYVLTCAVSVTAGTDAIMAALYPDLDLRPYKVLIVAFFIFVVMILNLRGLRESGTIFAFPTYFFVIAITILVCCGFWRVFVLGEVAHSLPTKLPDMNDVGLTWFLLLKAFSTGCAALTGIEAVANATPMFQDPPEKKAARTLSILGIILGTLLSGIAFLAYFYGIMPGEGNDAKTVLSQISEVIFGRGFAFYFIQAVTALILILAANTAFSAFPLLASIMAKDGFMPRMFSMRGDRLNFSNGIILLAFSAILLVIFFQGNLTSLIPLYAIGVFLSFTLSQIGMVRRWWKLKPSGWLPRFLLNLIGGIVTFVILSIFAITKFSEGAWLVLIVLPILVFTFYRIKLHYQDVVQQLKLKDLDKQVGFTKNLANDEKEHLIIIPIGGINRIVKNTIDYAQSLNGKIVALHVTFDETEVKGMAQAWQKWRSDDVGIVVLYSRFRSLVNPILNFIDHVHKPHRQITVIIPEFIPTNWWHRILHNQSSFLLRFFLLKRKDIVMTMVPYHLK